MLLLDRNNEPTNTVYYLAAVAHHCLGVSDGLDTSSLYQRICGEIAGVDVSYEFFVMALDFLYLTDAVSVDERGGLHVHQVASHS